MTTSKNKCNTLFGRIGKSADENAFEWVEFVRMIGQSNTDNKIQIPAHHISIFKVGKIA